MKRLFGILLIFGFISCSTTRQTVKSSAEGTHRFDQSQKITEQVDSETLHYGDTLRANIPLAKLSQEPMVYNMESLGTAIKLALTDTELKVESTVKPTSKTTTKTEIKTKTEIETEGETKSQTTTKTKTKRWQMPWWLSGVLVLIVLALSVLAKRYLRIV